MDDNSVDGFEMYRRQRVRRRLMHGMAGVDSESPPKAAPANALRELAILVEVGLGHRIGRAIYRERLGR